MHKWYFFFFFFLKQVRMSLKSPTLVLQENTQQLAGQAGHFEDRRDLWKGRWFIFLAFKSEIVLGFSAIRTLGHLLPSSFNRTLEGKPVSSWNWWRTHRSGLWAKIRTTSADSLMDLREMKGNLLSKKDFLIMSQGFLVSFLGQPELHSQKIQLCPTSARIRLDWPSTWFLENIAPCLTGILSLETEWRRASGVSYPCASRGPAWGTGVFWLRCPSVVAVKGTNTTTLRGTSCSLGRLGFVWEDLELAIGVQKRQQGVNSLFVSFRPKPQPASSRLPLSAVSGIAGLCNSFNMVLWAVLEGLLESCFGFS